MPTRPKYRIYGMIKNNIYVRGSHIKEGDVILYVRGSGKIGQKSCYIKYNSNGDLKYSRTLDEWGWWPLKIYWPLKIH